MQMMISTNHCAVRLIGRMSHVTASITTMFSTFDHTILPIAILLFHFNEATTDVTSSGSEVPTATTVSQITLSDIQKS